MVNSEGSRRSLNQPEELARDRLASAQGFIKHIIRITGLKVRALPGAE
jgi:hypothetical protein